MSPSPAHESAIGPGLACFRVRSPEGREQLMFVGELDVATAGAARAAIRRALEETPSLTCDLGDVWFVDLSGLRVLLDATAHAERTRGRLTITNCPPIVPRMLRLLRLEHALEIEGIPDSGGGASRRCAAIRRHVS